MDAAEELDTAAAGSEQPEPAAALTLTVDEGPPPQSAATGYPHQAAIAPSAQHTQTAAIAGTTPVFVDSPSNWFPAPGPSEQPKTPKWWEPEGNRRQRPGFNRYQNVKRGRDTSSQTAYYDEEGEWHSSPDVFDPQPSGNGKRVEGASSPLRPPFPFSKGASPKD